ncbi:MAG: hypothetical protein C5B59_18375 [Bacteroidetes bacterium]|nr:MAG: hypothetical protein C5B59_18375 [Bacteroidota bacterium]
MRALLPFVSFIILALLQFADSKAQSNDTTGMINASINDRDELVIVPSKNSSEKDFDFFFGNWKDSGKRLKTRLSGSHEWIDFTATLNCDKILQGYGNCEPFHAMVGGKDFEAYTLRLFDVKTKLWSIYYANPNFVTLANPQVGSFEGDIGWFYSKDIWNGKKIIIVYKWDKSNPEKPTMSQAFSTDNGRTWEWNLEQSFERIK